LDSVLVSDLIEKNLQELTQAETKVADLILHGEELPALLSIRELAGMAGVSNSTVIRFCRALGLSGFAELQQLSRESVLDRLGNNTPARLRRTREASGDLPELAQQVKELDLHNLAFYETLDYDLVESLVRDIRSARRIYVVGIRSCKPPAAYLAFALKFMRPEIHPLVGDISSDIDQLIDLDKSDLAVVFTVTRYTRHTIALTEAIAERGPTIYAVTDSLLSPLLSITDKVFLLTNRFLGIVPSLVGAFSFVHFLLAAVGVGVEDKTVKERLNALESLYSAYGMISDEAGAAAMFGGREDSHGGGLFGWSTELHH